MKTDDLIDRLSADLPPTPSAAIPARLIAAAGFGALAALVLVVAWLRVRPDISEAAAGAFFWVKAAYTAALGVAGFLAIERLARPAGSPRRGLVLAVLAVAALAAPAAWQLFAAEAAGRAQMWLGGSWTVCPRNILVLSLPMLALTLWFVRGLAPTRLALAGAAAGLFSGGVAATVYGLHCPEHTAAFVATWYTLGVLLTVALGALAGPRVLRW
ncbi:hypothetical protein C5708_09170 [Caulobacter sp. CCUG 60055]|uniref:NrsF family protein n=1 Tax=Caulobacter sp. CCUG 60055 TaxID=2100090 RepID=UPI001FA6EADD|nr:NrsF family protein [Caulobacter sp. CCUG 60055]MBQ1544129.1 DUF1109 family protein [Caulobacteraceae bacterium]MCI3180423.1 hypothetical protein [Caulobacter sp. CCUG 60055]